MNKSQKNKKTIQLLLDADRLMDEALRLSGKNRLFGDKIVDAQWHLDDAITYLDEKQTLLKK